MVNCQACSNCIHVKVCGKKDTYLKFEDAVHELVIAPTNTSFLEAVDCDDVVVSLKCKHYREDQPLTAVVTKC